MAEAAVLADALWRATTYASVCQLHLRGNVLLSEPLSHEHVKPDPSGHWGTVPGTAWALTHVALAAGRTSPSLDVVPILGAGHAGIVQLSMAWLSGELQAIRPQFTPDVDGLIRLSRAFPYVDGLGAEVHPALWAGDYLGGRLGGALAFAQGAALDAPDRVLVPVVGDGECETPTTAASWLATGVVPAAQVLPVIHVNGFRMGGRSLLGGMTDDQLRAYATGQGWDARVVHVVEGSQEEHAAFHDVFQQALDATSRGRRVAVFLRCMKGWGGPETVEGRRILGTPRAHKTPLSAPGRVADQLELLERWLAQYSPHELFDPDGRPLGGLARAMAAARWCRLRPTHAEQRPADRRTPLGYMGFGTFAGAVTTVIRDHAADGGFQVFSPDELASNRLGGLAREPWTKELLAEEVLLEWLAGWTASGRRGVLVSYEAFAPLLLSGVAAHLKQRRLAAAPVLPSLNLLLTSYGWNNVFTHGDPSFATALLAMGDPAVRVLTPADPTRTAVVLEEVLHSDGGVNVVVAGKHTATAHPTDTVHDEQAYGLAVWPHLSDDGEPDITIVTAGDLPAAVAAEAIPLLRGNRGCRVRVVNLLDLTVLGDPKTWPRGLSDADIVRYFGRHAAVLVVTLGHPAAVWGLLAGRLRRPIEVVGWQEPTGPMPQAQLADTLGLTPAGLAQAANRLLAVREAA
ncbi:phosphoketolase family protein [Streptomyces turgidiscabies]|uniref:phosphoketolase family protein n=1 Tax=Streptomyces turgidiscabies TaxID=85558 RepID=UPI0038F74A14